MDEVAPLLVSEDGYSTTPTLLSGFIFSLLTFLSGIGKLVFLPLLLGTFSDHYAPAHFILVITGIVALVFYGILLGSVYLYHNRAMKFLSVQDHWVSLFGSGVLFGIGRVMITYFSFPDRTTPVIQSLFGGVSIVFGLLSLKLFSTNPRMPCFAVAPILGTLLILVGCGLGLYEGIEAMVSDGTGILDRSLWEILFIFSFLFVTSGQTLMWLFWLNNFEQLKSVNIRTGYWFMLNVLFWVQFAEVITYVLFFWVDVVPTIGYTDSIELFFVNFGHAAFCFFNECGENNTLLYGLLYILSVIVYDLSQIGLVHPRLYIVKAVAEGLVVPVSVILWMFVPLLIEVYSMYFIPELWMVFVSLAVIVVGHIFIRSWQFGLLRRLRVGSAEETWLIEEDEIGSSVENPEGRSSLASQFMVSWITPLVILGKKQPLQFNDIWKPSLPDCAQIAGKKLENAWEIEKQKKNPSVARAFMSSFGELFILPFTMFSVHLVASLIGPGILMRELLVFLETNEQDSSVGWILTFGVFFTQLIASSTIQYSFQSVTTVGVRLKQAMMYVIYRKTLKLNTVTSSGEVVNLSSNDSQRLFLLARSSQMGWSALALSLAGGGLLIAELGWAGVVGLISLLLYFPLQILIGKHIGNIRRTTIKVTDQRVRTMSDVLSAVQLIKFCTWESSFSKKIETIREDEVRGLRKAKIYKSINDTISFVGITITTYIMLLTYVLLGNPLVSSKAFTAITLLNIMRVCLIRVPTFVKSFGETNVTFQRLQNFLLKAEMVDKRDVHKDKDGKVFVRIIDGEFSVGNEVMEQKREIKSGSTAENGQQALEHGFTLQNINLFAEPGQLIAIVGTVGCGKSSLLNAVLGQIEMTRGKVEISGSIAFASQQPWLVNASLKENILFGMPYNEKRYNKALECCELLADLKQLPAGDMTEIGERGINLSGGQKQRVSLARAVYTNKDIYLLDDPLSAVDRHVGNNLFDNCINGILKPKLVLLVTNQLQYLNQCDRIIYLNNGNIDGTGTLNDLMQSNKTFRKLLKQFTSTIEKEKEEDTKKNVKVTTKIDTSGRKEKGDLMTEEFRALGNVQLKTYLDYAKSGGLGLSTCVLILSVLTSISQVSSSWIVSFWIDNQTTQTMEFFIGIYGVSVILFVIFTSARGFVFAYAVLTSATNIHNSIFKIVMRAPMSFFFTTPMGRIINRFSSDQDKVDETLPDLMFPAIHFSLNSICTVGVIVGVIPWFGLTAIPMILIFGWIISYFMATSRELRRLEAISISPTFSHLTATLRGLPTIRAYGATPRFEEDYVSKLNQYHSTLYIAETVSRWVGIRLDMIGTCLVAMTAILIMVLKDSISPSLAGLALSYSFQMTGAFQFAVRSFAETDSQMTSVERLLAYKNEIPQEAPEKILNNRPSPDWPSQGCIEFHDVCMKYETSDVPVLKNLSFTIKPREKIGIVGRTGAGKSSVTLALFRLIELYQGVIEIDGIDISKIGLKDLRRNLSIIPQDPVLFLGTIRSNLDPWEKYSDAQVMSVLAKVRMDKVIQELQNGLDSTVSEGGTNFSLGQRQLLCISRALLLDTKILILDEATASIDIETDNLIQHTIRESFKDCTVLTIAHRLHTIIDCDRIMVLDSGRLAEYDTPSNLLSRDDSIFTGLVNETDDSESLKKIAAVYLNKE